MPARLMMIHTGVASGIALGAVAVADTVAYSDNIGNGPLYGMVAVLGAAVLAAITQLFIARRKIVPQTPDVAAKLEVLTITVAELGQAVVDDRRNEAERLAMVQKVTDDKIAANRHEQKNFNQRVELMLQDIQRRLPPAPEGGSK